MGDSHELADGGRGTGETGVAGANGRASKAGEQGRGGFGVGRSVGREGDVGEMDSVSVTLGG